VPPKKKIKSRRMRWVGYVTDMENRRDIQYLSGISMEETRHRTV
jgi:hypothetical protein